VDHPGHQRLFGEEGDDLSTVLVEEVHRLVAEGFTQVGSRQVDGPAPKFAGRGVGGVGPERLPAAGAGHFTGSDQFPGEPGS